MRLEHHKKPRRSRSQLLYFRTMNEALDWGMRSLFHTLDEKVFGDIDITENLRTCVHNNLVVSFEQGIGRGGEYVRGCLRARSTNKRIGIQTRNLYYGD